MISDAYTRAQEDPASEDFKVMLTTAITALDTALDDLTEARLHPGQRGLWHDRLTRVRVELDTIYRAWDGVRTRI